MIKFIFIVILAALLLLILSFIIKNYTLGMISSMAMIVIGVFILANDIESISNLLTLSLGIIYIGLGSYVFIGGNLEELKQY